jgi:hypothetical protein
MNKLLYLAIGLFLMAGNHLSAQYWSTSAIKGEGEVVRQEITLPALKGIDLGFSGNVILTPGPVQKVVLEGQQNILDLIKRDVVGGNWKIYFSKNVKDVKNVTVYITLPAIETVALTGSGSVNTEGKFSGLNDLKLSLTGSGDINFETDARSVDAHVSGSGDIEVSGSAGALEVTISGSGDVTATSLAVNSCEIHISGSGDAEVDVNGDLEVYISGSGDVYYRGNASVTAKVTGSGEVKSEK